jgi:exosortase
VHCEDMQNETSSQVLDWKNRVTVQRAMARIRRVMKALNGNAKRNLTPRNRALVFACLCAVSILLWWHPLGITLGLALANDAYTHILLILPMSAALIYFDAKHFDSAQQVSKTLQIEPQPSPRVGAALLVLALLIGAYARWWMVAVSGDVRLSVGMFALVTWWIASVLSCFGARSFRSFVFPLCFLFLMVPIPEFALRWIVEFLQQQSAVAARITFRAFGVPVTQDGIMLSIPGLDIEVGPECSSIRSSLILIVTTLVLAHLFLRSWWRKALLVVAAIPLSVAKNGLRIFTITELGTRVDPEFLSGKLHQNGGIIFFGVAVGVEALLLWILWRTESRMQFRNSAAALRE